MVNKNEQPAVTTVLTADMSRATTLADKSSKIFILASPGAYPCFYRTVPYFHFQRGWKSRVTPKSSPDKSECGLSAHSHIPRIRLSGGIPLSAWNLKRYVVLFTPYQVISSLVPGVAIGSLPMAFLNYFF